MTADNQTAFDTLRPFQCTEIVESGAHYPGGASVMLVRRVTRAGDLKERLAHREMGHGGSWIVDDDTVSIRQLCALPIAAEYGRQDFARPEAPSLFRTGTFSFSRYVEGMGKGVILRRGDGRRH